MILHGHKGLHIGAIGLRIGFGTSHKCPDLKAYGKEVWLRPLHEANGNWYSWGVGTSGAGNTDSNVIAAWKHIVQIFRDSSVSNVKWVWTTNASNSGTGSSLMGAYPGDDWVDYNSIDGYNWGTSQSWSKWQTFTQVFSPAYTLLAAHNIPIFIPEFASSELGGSKAQWIQNMFNVLPTSFPKIFALMWFNQSSDADWAVNTSDSSLQAWKAGIANASSAVIKTTRAPVQNTSANHMDALGRIENKYFTNHFGVLYAK